MSQLEYDPSLTPMVTDETGRKWPGVPGYGNKELRLSGATPLSKRRSITPVLKKRPPEHPEYESRTNKYEFFRSSYVGGSDYKEANDATGEPIFIPHATESNEASDMRKRLSLCRNYTFPICQKFGSFIFSQTIVRDNKVDAFNEWAKDVDGFGTCLADFMESAATEARYLGVYGIVFDTNKETPIQSKAESSLKGNRPVLSCLHPSRIINWTDDKQNLLVQYDIGEFGQVWLWSKLTYQKFNLDKAGKVASAEEPIAHGYSRMPIILMNGLDEWESLIRDVAEAQKRLFNYDSVLIEEIYRNVFSSYLLIGVDGEQITDSATPIAVGGRKFTCIKSAPDQVRVQLLGSDTSQAASIRSNIEADEIYIYRAIGLYPPEMNKGGAPESGRSLRIREAETVAMTERVASNIEYTENVIIDLFNESVKPETEVTHTKYPNEFNADDIQVLLQDTLQVVSNDFGPKIKAAQITRYIRQAFPEMEPDERDALEAEAISHATESDERAKAGPVQPNNPNGPEEPGGPEQKTEKSAEQPPKGKLGVTIG